MQLSQHFRRSEFACRCGCGFDTVDIRLVQVLEEVRLHFDAPVIVTSGCRCRRHNRDEGGVPYSQHVRARAADIKVRGVKPSDVYDYLDAQYPGGLGLGRYDTFTHVDTRSDGPARWSG